MGVVIGFVFGYMMGTRDGQEGYEEIKEAWHTIRTSDEAHDLVAQGLSMAKGLLGRGAGIVSERLQASSSTGGNVRSLRPTG